MDLFKDVLYGILNNKKETFEDPEAERVYVPFLINRALSYHQDTLFYANDMNLYNQLDKKPQIDYYLNSIRSKKRPFVKWAKPIKEGDLQAVKMYYGYSDSKAETALKLLTKEQLTLIKEKTNTGE